ncbi:MAG: DMT family transporter [Amphritea sp.]
MVAIPLSNQLKGILFGLIAALIWSGHSIVSSLGIAAGLSAYDLTALRIITNLLIFLPFILKSKAQQRAGLTAIRGLVLALCAGATFSVVITSGLLFAPVTHSGGISLGTVPLFAFLLVTWVGSPAPAHPCARRPFLVRESASMHKKPFHLSFFASLLLILAGIVLITLLSAQPSLSPDFWIGDLLFLCGGLMWASYAILGQRWQINAVLGVAATNFFSIPYLVIYYFYLEPGLSKVSLGQLSLQIIYQGILVGGVALVCYMRSVALLGVEKGALFTALAPVGVIILGSLVLDYQATLQETIGIVLVTSGMLVALRLKK